MGQPRRKLPFTREELLTRMRETKDPLFVGMAERLSTSKAWQPEDVLALIAGTLDLTYDQAFDLLEGPDHSELKGSFQKPGG